LKEIKMITLNRLSLRIFCICMTCTLCAGNVQLSLAVLPLHGHNISPGDAALLTDRLINELFRLEGYQIVERQIVEAVLEEQKFQLSGLTSDKYLVGLGQILGVQRILAGSVGKIEDVYTISLRLIDTENAELVQTISRDTNEGLNNFLTNVLSQIAMEISFQYFIEIESNILIQNFTFTPDEADKGMISGAIQGTSPDKTVYILFFDGEDDYYECAPVQGLDLSMGGTIEAWIFPESRGENDWGRIIDKSNGFEAEGGYSLYMTANNSVAFEVDDVELVSDPNSIEYNKWSYVAVTFDRALWSLYVNGKINKQVKRSLLPSSLVSPVYIGNRSGNTDRTFDGGIASIKIYKTALPAHVIFYHSKASF